MALMIPAILADAGYETVEMILLERGGCRMLEKELDVVIVAVTSAESWMTVTSRTVIFDPQDPLGKSSRGQCRVRSPAQASNSLMPAYAHTMRKGENSRGAV